MQLQTYLQTQGYGSAAALARAIKAGPSDIVQWAKGRKKVPKRRALDIERATAGAVTRRDLCPDWADHWPELAQQQAQPQQPTTAH